MSSLPYSLGLPVYDNAEFTRGLDSFVIKAKTSELLRDLYFDIVDITPESQIVLGHPMGIRPDHPVPRPMWFMEVGIRNEEDIEYRILIGWPLVYHGCYRAENKDVNEYHHKGGENDA